MAYENNGTARSLYVTITKEVGGNVQQGYPHVYNGQNSWGNILYPTLSDAQARQLSDVDFAARLAAFEAYVESVEAGLDFTTDIVGNGSTKYDPANCGNTTTTTEAAPPVYAFSIKYGKYPVDVCTGTNAVVYSSVQTPVVGTTLYKNAALTQKWNTTNGEHILFASPVIYSNKAVQMSLSTGKVLAITTFDCGGITPVGVYYYKSIVLSCETCVFESTLEFYSTTPLIIGHYYSNGNGLTYLIDEEISIATYHLEGLIDYGTDCANAPCS